MICRKYIHFSLKKIVRSAGRYPIWSTVVSQKPLIALSILIGKKQSAQKISTGRLGTTKKKVKKELRWVRRDKNPTTGDKQ